LELIPIFDRLALASVVAIAAVWVAYPVVISGLAALIGPIRRPRPRASVPQSVTVIVASREPGPALRQRVHNLLQADLPEDALDIVIGVHESAFLEMNAAVASFSPRVRVVPTSVKGKPSALNAAVAAATGEVLVFADTYQAFDPDTIPNLLEGFTHACVGAVSGRLELPQSTPALVSAYWSMERALRRGEAVVHSSIGVTGAVYAMRRALWRDLPEQLLLDDLYGPMRLILDGYRIAFQPNARACDNRAVEPAREYRRKVRTLTGVLQLCSWMPGVLIPIRNPVWLQFMFHKVLRLLTPYLLLVVAIWTVLLSTALPTALGWALLLATVLAVVWLLRTRRPFGARLRAVATEGLLLQAATIVAGFNGLRGKWQVWD
jgi:cellulose synthase/poly-beta-1,6-N-acetylglucosamine synthase-like glycosyltransferase